MKEKIKSYLVKILPQKFKKFIKHILYRKPLDEVSIIEQLFHEASGVHFVMLDVGAHHGSACIPFARKNWTVYAFEPDVDNRNILLGRINEFENLHIDPRAVSDESDRIVPFYTSNVSTGISGLSSFHASHTKATEVKTVRLDDFCLQNNIHKIHFLKIDAEGYDLMVLKSYDWQNQIHPQFIIAEFENSKTIPLGYTLEDMIQFLESKGYSVLISEWYPIVEYGGTHKWNKFSWSHKLVDNNRAWGNIIACKDGDVERLKAVITK